MSDDNQKTEILHETRRNLNAGKVVFSRFELERELGSGGMGVVWLAKDLEVEGRVALKFLPGLVRDPIAERDLRDEVKNARNLVHENIVSVRTLHKDEASIAVEMEYVDGPNLTMLIRDTPNRFLDVDKAGPIVRGLCLAIDHAWLPPRRLVHRDIKPHNLLVDSAGHVKVVDFGIAHTVSETVSRLTGQTGSERVVGTLPYMSPQQLKGEVHHSNDVYSIGATIYHVLTGSPPFRATDPAVLTQQINTEPAMSIAERRKQLAHEGRAISGAQSVPRAWEETIAACLAKDPSLRPATAREIAVRLGLAEPAAGGTRPTVGGETGPSKKLLALAACLVAGAAGIVGYIALQPAAPRESAGAATTAATPAGRLAAGGANTAAANSAAIAGDPVVSVAAGTATNPAPGSPSPSASIAVGAAPSSAGPAASQTAPAPIVLRESWRLVATEAAQVLITRETAGAVGAVEFEGALAVGEKRSLPVDQSFVVRLKEGKGLGVEFDGQKVLPLSSPAGRWIVTVPANSNDAPVLKEAPLPFEAEVGPLWQAGQINEAEADWLRAALGGAHGEAERTLVSRLFEKPTPLTIGQWRAKTAMKFPPVPAALTAGRPTQLARALDLPLPGGALTMRLLRIEPGTYRRGSLPDERGRRPSDPPAGNAVVAKPFFIGIFEVTHGEFEAIAKNNPSFWRRLRNPALPVDQVTWASIMAGSGFIPLLNAQLRTAYDGLLIADLPTDEEWEYAARAGTVTAFNNGTNLVEDEKANEAALAGIAYYGKSDGPPRPAGSLAPNAWGLHDMHGNLQEWTKDNTVRGGSWSSPAAAMRSASRNPMARDAGASSQTGFRLVIRLREPTDPK